MGFDHFRGSFGVDWPGVVLGSDSVWWVLSVLSSARMSLNCGLLFCRFIAWASAALKASSPPISTVRRANGFDMI